MAPSMVRVVLSTLSMPLRFIFGTTFPPHSRAGIGRLTHVTRASSRASVINARCAVGSPLPATSGAEGCVYLDYAATCPIYPDVSKAMEPFFCTQWGNPSSPHAFGVPSKRAVDNARAQVAELLHCSPAEVIFTSCGSEADNWAIIGAIKLAKERLGGELPHVVTSRIEHPAISECIAQLELEGALTCTWVEVDMWGRVAVDRVAQAVQPNTALVTIMHANNEVGTVQPIREIVAAVRSKNKDTLVHTDAAQTVGKVPVSVKDLGVDMLTVVGHKFGAPKGVGALYVRQGIHLPKLLYGGGQEGGQRAGTECVPLIVGLGEAAAVWMEQGHQISLHSAAMRDRLLEALESKLGRTRLRVNSPLLFDADEESGDWPCIPNVLSVGIRGVQSSDVLHLLSTKVAASASAACHSGAGKVSSVLGELGVPKDFAQGTMRLSVGRHTTATEVDLAARQVVEAVHTLDRRGG